jgi:hypothetical protein
MGNKHIIKRWLAPVVALAIIISPLVTSSYVLAASASMYLTTSGSSVKGGTLSVSIRENSGGEPVNAASATITYPTSLLSYLSTSNSGAFGIAAATSGGGGSAHVERGALSTVSGAQTVAIVNFRVLSDSGTATINFSDGQVLSANTNGNIAGGFSGVSAHLSAPVVAPPPDTIPPKITDVKVSAITSTSATVNWTTTEPATSEVDYGPTNGYGLSAADGNLVTDHKVVINSSFLDPAKTYHFMVKSADAAGNAVSATDATFTTLGAKALVTITDQHKKPVSGVKVSILDNSATTDKNGKATISGLTIGKQTLVVTFRHHDFTKVVTVSQPDPKNTPQSLSMELNVVTSPYQLLAIITLLVALAFIIWMITKDKMPPSISKYIDKVKPKIKPIIPTRPNPSVVTPSPKK